MERKENPKESVTVVKRADSRSDPCLRGDEGTKGRGPELGLPTNQEETVGSPEGQQEEFEFMFLSVEGPCRIQRMAQKSRRTNHLRLSIMSVLFFILQVTEGS